LSMLFTCSLSHGYLPSALLKTIIVPLVKNKTSNIGDKSNYRPIALVTSASKIFELILLDLIENYITTSDNQFGFKLRQNSEFRLFRLRFQASCGNGHVYLYAEKRH
jgi:hypothetical protein